MTVATLCARQPNAACSIPSPARRRRLACFGARLVSPTLLVSPLPTSLHLLAVTLVSSCWIFPSRFSSLHGTTGSKAHDPPTYPGAVLRLLRSCAETPPPPPP